MTREQRIRQRVLRAIALNRTPGYHFPGNFVDLSFDRVENGSARVSYETDAELASDLGALSILADFALGTAIRTDLHPATRLGTISMTLELARAPHQGIVTADSRCHGFVGEGDSRTGRGRVSIEDGKGEIGYGSGAFMVLQPPSGVTLHPVPHRRRGDAEPPVLHEHDLEPDELPILRRADEALERAAKTRQPFIRHFWGFLPPAGGRGGRRLVRDAERAARRQPRRLCPGRHPVRPCRGDRYGRVAGHLDAEQRLRGVHQPGPGAGAERQGKRRAPGPAHGGDPHRARAQRRPPRARSHEHPRGPAMIAK
jgi:acyl-coenzyme A thioesterase PaaI-like protein